MPSQGGERYIRRGEAEVEGGGSSARGCGRLFGVGEHGVASRELASTGWEPKTESAALATF
jgi:hypothetical protein